MEIEPREETAPANKKDDPKPADAGPAAGTRAQHIVRVVPRDWGSLAAILTPAMERIDPTLPGTQVLVITSDAAATYAVVRGAFAKFGTVGIDLFPATAEGRAARIMATVPVPAVAGPPSVLHALLRRSVLRLDTVRAIVFAWIEDLVEEDPEALAQLEAVLAEVPREATKSMVVRRRSVKLDAFVDSHMFRARQFAPPGPEETKVSVALEYVVAPAASRPAMLWRVLDEMDPPSAVVITRDSSSEADARSTLVHLGYRRAEDPIRLSSGNVPANTHTVVFYDTPLTPADLQNVAAASPARLVTFVEPGDIESLKELTPAARPLQISAAVKQARRQEDVLRGEIKQLLDGGVAFHELRALEPLLDIYDGVEIAAALLRLLEKEREKVIAAVPVAPRAQLLPRGPREAAQGARGEFRGRGERGQPGWPEPGRPERGRPERGRPERGRPERGRPERGRPERGRPERGRPSAGRPERGRPPRPRDDRR